MADDSTEVRHLQALIDERDRRYTERFDAQERAVQAALAAAEKLVSTAFAASEKAVLKQEQAQADYNIRSNEFRGQLADQAKMLMPRAEAEASFRQQRELIDRVRDESLKGLEAHAITVRREFDSIRADVGGLRESRSAVTASAEAERDRRSRIQWAVGVGIGVAGLLIAAAVYMRPPL